LVRVDHYRAYDVARAKLPHRRENAKRVLAEWRRNNPEKAARYRRENPEKYRAQTAVGNAVRSGRLKRPSECESCDAVGFKPLDVSWLCKPCHMKADQERRAA